MEGLLAIQQKFDEQHKKDPNFGQVTIMREYPYPIDVLIDGNIPATASFLGNLTGLSTGQFCTDINGVQCWVSASRVVNRERNYRPGLAAQNENKVLTGSNR